MRVPTITRPVGMLEADQVVLAEQLLESAIKSHADVSVALALFNEAGQMQLWLVANRGASEAYQDAAQLQVIYARSFLFSMSRAVKVLSKLNGEAGLVGKITLPIQKLNDQLTELTAMRDSSAHAEDRLRGKGKHGKTITPKGGAGDPFFFECLEGPVFFGNAEDGSIASIEVSERSRDFLTTALQEAIHLLPFRMVNPLWVPHHSARN